MSRFQGIAFLALTILLTADAAAAESLRLVVNGKERTALLEQPTGQGPRPTIIVLHGLGGTAAAFAQQTGLGQLGPRAGFVSVFPQGVGSRWNAYPPGKETPQFVQYFRPHGGVPDDIAFFKALVADLVHRGISDPKRIYLAGLSAGGFMTLRMACVELGMFAAIGVLAGAMADPTGEDCHPAKPLPALLINATADKLVPYEGGVVTSPTNIYSIWSTQKLVAFLRKLNGCTEEFQQSVVPGQHAKKIEIESSIKCPGGPVILYRIVEGGHQIPPSLNAGQLLLDFFRDKVR
jgi:polyhydroxybutyrate depolymerase